MKDDEFAKFAEASLAKSRPAVVALPADFRNGLLGVIREKIRTGKELAEWLDPYLTEDYPYSEEARKKQFSNPEAGKWLTALEKGFSSTMEPLSELEAEAVCKKVAEEAGLPKPAKVIHLLRSAVSGHTVGPSLFHLLVVLGKTKVVARLKRTRILWEEGKLGGSA
jgi:glutamyl-tRNA synthetase